MRAEPNCAEQTRDQQSVCPDSGLVWTRRKSTGEKDCDVVERQGSKGERGETDIGTEDKDHYRRDCRPAVVFS